MSVTVKLLLILRLFGQFSHIIFHFTSKTKNICIDSGFFFFFRFPVLLIETLPYFVFALTESPHFNKLRDGVCFDTPMPAVPAVGFLSPPTVTTV